MNRRQLFSLAAAAPALVASNRKAEREPPDAATKARLLHDILKREGHTARLELIFEQGIVRAHECSWSQEDEPRIRRLLAEALAQAT